MVGFAWYSMGRQARARLMTGVSAFGSPDAEAGLVSRLVAGDERALAVLFDRFGSVAYGLAYAITSDSATAEAVVADVFSQVWREASMFPVGRMTLLAWLTKLVRAGALATRRSMPAAPAFISNSAPGAPGASASGAPTESATATTPPSAGHAESLASSPMVIAAMGALSDGQRQVVELAYFHGLTRKEIATRLQLTESGVAQQLRTAVDALRLTLMPPVRVPQQITLGRA